MITDRSAEPDATFAAELARIEAAEVAPESYACTCGHEGLAAEWHADGCGKPIPGEACACGHDETDHGNVVGCIHCGACDEYLPRSTYRSRGETDEDVVERVARAIGEAQGAHGPFGFPCKCGWDAGFGRGWEKRVERHKLLATARAALSAVHDRDGQR